METIKSKALKELITSSKTEFLMEAHNGLSARIVEESGFKGIWASSPTLAASLA
jgi:phosphoenolpyruvate phosphomutase